MVVHAIILNDLRWVLDQVALATLIILPVYIMSGSLHTSVAIPVFNQVFVSHIAPLYIIAMPYLFYVRLLSTLNL